MHSAIRTQEVNPAKLALLFRKQFELCRLGPGQTVAIVSDLGTRREYIQAGFAAAEAMGVDIYEMCVNAIPGWTSVGVATIGQCKGTLEALSVADMVLIFHVPLFSKWLKQVMNKGVRVQMIIDAPDDLYNLQSPPGSEGSGAARRKPVPEDAAGARHEPGRHRPQLPLRRIPGDEPMGNRRRAGPLRPLGRRSVAHLPERRQRRGPGRDRAGRHRHPAVLPLRHRCDSPGRRRRAHHAHRRRCRRGADARVARRRAR